MTFRDSTDQEIAEEILKRLHARGLRTVRGQEEVAPVSRTTLSAWANGRYAMQGRTREACLEWLGETPPDARELTEAEEKRIAAKWIERMAERLREEASADSAAGAEAYATIATEVLDEAGGHMSQFAFVQAVRAKAVDRDIWNYHFERFYRAVLYQSDHSREEEIGGPTGAREGALKAGLAGAEASDETRKASQGRRRGLKPASNGGGGRG